ncbi:hypothetical protein KOW79_010898 [Hemibagrus wyckioides]|uniref:Uncharacterized protein n=1 Tax=Hemibagrus wyckioides TaxID=337641 RepID=A0A9D3NN64_9TELE|nr:hypothetical protein KOW79_010898 [Hemibagrus wyckioides]
MSQMISKFCDEINLDGKSIYTSGHPYSTDCEPTWYAQNGTVLGTKLSLFLDTCESWIRLLIRCLQSEKMYEYVFQVINRTTLIGETKPTKTDGHELRYLWLLLILVPLILLVLYFVCRKQDCSTPRNEEGAAVMNNTPKKEEAQALNGHTNGIPKCDDGNLNELRHVTGIKSSDKLVYQV